MQARDELRQLCGDYFHGLISRDAYRQQRGRILDRLILGQEAAPHDRTVPRGTVQSRAPAAADGAVDDSTVAAEKVSAKPSGWSGLFVAGIAVMLVTGIAWYLLRTSAGPAIAVRTPGAPASAIAERPGAFIERFGPASGWNERTYSEFLGQWDYLPDAEREAVRESPSFRAMTEDLQSRIRELRALVDPSDPASVEQFRWVVSFARQLDIDPGVSDVELPSREIPRAPPVVPEPMVPAAPGAAMPSVAEIASPAESPEPATPPSPSTSSEQLQPAAANNVPRKTEPGVAVVPAAPARATARSCRQELAKATALERRKCFDMIDVAIAGPTMIVLPAGEFQMGSTDDKVSSPVRTVRIAAAFAMGVHEVSAGEYRKFCSDAGRACPVPPGSADDEPATNVSWQDAVAYTDWLSARTGARYRLPSEAEWEYAARAGSTARYPFGNELTRVQAVFAAKSAVSRKWSAVGNDFGLRHMVGNAREWVADPWIAGFAGAPVDGRAREGRGAQRVVRGGSFSDDLGNVTSASRVGLDAGHKDSQTGFRVLRVL